jgi:NadR type nicotinamide-nucleotide adenylyltransferase
LVLGKFLPYHAGHAHLIRSARARVDVLTVLVCSLQSEPIEGSIRHQWVRASHPDCRVIHVREEVPQTPDESPLFWTIWADLIARHAGHVDWVFTSETYGDELAHRIGAHHECVDPERRTVPVSGTAVRSDPMGNWEHIPDVVRPYFVRRVAILGAESTGKTCLARHLGTQYATTWVPEFGRAYCDGRDARDLGIADFDAIARGQIAAEDEAASRANRLLICDTELHTTCTWSDLVIGARPPWLTDAAMRRPYDLMLLLGADVPWVDDGTRVWPSRRSEHTARLREELERANRPYLLLAGTFEERTVAACRAVDDLLGGSFFGDNVSGCALT